MKMTQDSGDKTPLQILLRLCTLLYICWLATVKWCLRTAACVQAALPFLELREAFAVTEG